MSMEQSITERWSIAAGTELGPVHLLVTNRDPDHTQRSYGLQYNHNYPKGENR
jgi:hypothetical protein